jgi:hypothetical protein
LIPCWYWFFIHSVLVRHPVPGQGTVCSTLPVPQLAHRRGSGSILVNTDLVRIVSTQLAVVWKYILPIPIISFVLMKVFKVIDRPKFLNCLGFYPGVNVQIGHPMGD